MLKPLEPTLDLGSLKYGKPKSFTYLLTNESDSTIIVDKIIVGCGSCTTAKMEKTTIPPGERSILQATFTPGSTGKQLKHIQLKHRDGSVLKLEFTADVHD